MSDASVPVAADPAMGRPRSVIEHLKELRDRLLRAVIALFVSTAASMFLAKRVLTILIAPLGDTLPQALKPTESIGNYMRVALICGVTLAMPFIVYQIGAFVMPALTKTEKRYMLLLVPGATVCFVAGVAFAYFLTHPIGHPIPAGLHGRHH